MSVGVLHGGSLAGDAGMSASASVASCKATDGGDMTRTSACFVSLHRKISRDVAANALWRAFPAPSEHALCTRAAAVLDTSPDTIRRIVRKETDAKLSLIWPILALALASRGIDALDVVDGGE